MLGPLQSRARLHRGEKKKVAEVGRNKKIGVMKAPINEVCNPVYNPLSPLFFLEKNTTVVPHIYMTVVLLYVCSLDFRGKKSL